MAGESAITATARDEYGREAKAVLRVVYDSHESGLQGTVINVVTGEPVDGVVLTSGAVVAQTGADGTYSLPLAPGNQTVTLQAEGYVARDVPVIVNEGGVTNHTFELIPTTGTDDALSITSPSDGAIVPGQTVDVVGIVRLAHVASVKVNDVEATLSSGTFKATAQTPAGVKTTILVTATSLDGIELMRTIAVTGTAPLKKSGCTSAGEASVIAMLALIALRRRMRQA
jgi:hypothetical protein